MKSIRGVIVKVFKHDKDTGFSIMQIKGVNEESSKSIFQETKGKELLTVLGNYFNPKPGGFVTCEGEFSNHQRWGTQFKAKSIFMTKATFGHHPMDIIQSSLIRSLNKKAKSRLVAAYKDDVLRILNNRPEKFIEDKVLSPIELDMLKKDWNRASKLFRSFDYLKSLGMSRVATDCIVEAHGNTSKEIIANNPYGLLDVRGVGFKNIDKATAAMGMELTSDLRIRHGLKYTINNFASQGHTAFYLDYMSNIASKRMGVEPAVIESMLMREVESGKFSIVKGKKGPMLVDYGTYKRELDCAKELKRLAEAPFAGSTLDIKMDTEYLKSGQQTAVKNTVLNKVSVITGGPGVGKTTVVKSIIDALSHAEPMSSRILMAAPTGKAARRMEESTGIQAETIHTMLDYHPEEGFRRNANSPLDVDTVIIDEGSMVDINLFYSLVKAIPTGTRLVMVGDVDQLESVGPGAVLSDIINSGQIKTSVLNEVQRQAAESMIVNNAHKINNGEMPDFNPGKLNDFHWIDADDDEKIKEVIRSLSMGIPKHFGIEHDNIQVLTPVKDHASGVTSLNEMLREVMNPSDSYSFSKPYGDFKLNDRVMQMKNNKDLDINNGEVGKIKFIDFKSRKATIDFDGVSKNVPFDNFNDLQHAYAKTIHKSQGSEYDAVIIPISEKHSRLNKKMLYTALTRGKKLVFLVGSKAALAKSLSNDRNTERLTMLNTALVNEIGGSLFTPLYDIPERNVQKRKVANGPEPNF